MIRVGNFSLFGFIQDIQQFKLNVQQVRSNVQHEIYMQKIDMKHATIKAHLRLNMSIT